MSVFCLVHGAWHTPWHWAPLARELRSRGHLVVTPDLPAGDPTAGALRYADVVLDALAGAGNGMTGDEVSVPGDSVPSDSVPGAGATGDAVTRDGAASDGATGDLIGTDVILVGHSLAGLILPLVPARRPVRRLVLLAALLPEPGRSFDQQLAGDRGILRRGLGAGQLVHPDGSTEWQPEAAALRFYPDAPPALAVEAATRLRRQQWLIFREVTPLTGWPPMEYQVITCADDAVVDPDRLRTAARERLGVDAVELPGDHSPFLSRPRLLADLLTAAVPPPVGGRPRGDDQSEGGRGEGGQM
jgi:pimeloyl-ACP methyl ester carboxylesterase